MFVQAQPDDADADAGALEGFYFAWGKQTDSAYEKFPDVISQSYINFTIGGSCLGTAC